MGEKRKRGKIKIIEMGEPMGSLEIEFRDSCIQEKPAKFNGEERHSEIMSQQQGFSQVIKQLKGKNIRKEGNHRMANSCSA